MFLVLHQKEPLFTHTPPQGQVAGWLVIGQAPEGVPRKNPVRGRIGRQKLDGKGIGNDTK